VGDDKKKVGQLTRDRSGGVTKRIEPMKLAKFGIKRNNLMI